MKLYFLLFLIILFAGCSTQLKKYYLTADHVTYIDTSANNSCNRFMNYAPDEDYPGHTPMRWIRMNFHIMADSSGKHNFTLEEGTKFVKEVLRQANLKLRNNQPLSLPEGNNIPVLPFKYQYILTPDPDDPDNEGVYIHYDNDLFYHSKTHSKNSNVFSRAAFDKYGVQKGEVLNVFMKEHHPDSVKSKTYKASIDGVGFKDFLKTAGWFQHHYDTTWNDDGSFTVRGPNYNINILNHEMGHTLGITHTWNTNDGCDDTPRNPGCWDHNSKGCSETGIYSNNMMDYNNCQCALSPCQIAKIQYNLSRPNSTQRNLLLPTWCVYKPDSTITIGMHDEVTWNSSKDLEGDIVIESGGSLTIKCTVSLPADGRVIVQPDAKLILAGGVITNKCSDEWNGIEVWKRRKEAGEVVFIGDAAIENAKHPLDTIAK